jgi:anti-sigma B factor antagonist
VLPSASPARSQRVRALTATTPALSPTLGCTISADGDVVTVAPTGELDIDTVPVLDRDLRDVRDIGYRTIVVDLRGLTFIDSAGVQLLLRWATGAARRGDELRLIPGSDRVQLVFRLTGVLDALGFERTLHAA